jgi:hypothetical protein
MPANGKNNGLTEAQLRLLVETMRDSLLQGNRPDTMQVVNTLINETIRFRDKLLEERGEILTVGDTRAALEALECHFKGIPAPLNLTPEQKALARIWIDRLTIFR